MGSIVLCLYIVRLHQGNNVLYAITYLWNFITYKSTKTYMFKAFGAPFSTEQFFSFEMLLLMTTACFVDFPVSFLDIQKF